MSIKLIAADMDGTLLSSRKQLPKGFFPLVRTLKKIGVRFAPASGRQYYNLYEQFGEIADELMYISENGGMVCDGREIVSFEAMPQQLVCAAVELVLCSRGQPGAALACSGMLGAALCAADPALACAAAGLACGASAACILAPGRRVEAAAAYAGGCVTGVLCVQPLAGAFGFLLSAGAGAGLCALLPAGWLAPAAKDDDPPGDLSLIHI